MNKLTTYTVDPLPAGVWSLTHGVYQYNEVGARSVALCFREADAQRVMDALVLAGKVHEFNTQRQDWDSAMELDRQIHELAARVVNGPLDSPPQKADDTP